MQDGSLAANPWRSAFAAEPWVNTLTAGNRVRVLRDGAEALPAMFSALRTARHRIHLEYYVLENIHCDGQSLGDVLIERRHAGVQVAVIADALGSSGTPGEFFRALQKHGVQLLQFNPLNPLNALKAHSPYSWNRRDHRKILIVDGRLAITGGINMSLAYEQGAHKSASRPINGAPPERCRWRDTALQLEGPAVAQLQRLFLDHWAQQRGERLDDVEVSLQPGYPGGDLVGIIGSAPTRPSYYQALLTSLRAAQHRVWITAGYFLPPAALMHELVRAARRRLDVRLLLPSHNDSVASLAVQRSAYAKLLQAGVKVFERKAVVLHSKSILVDHSCSFVGSSNLDNRSARFNDEVDALIISAQTAATLAQLFADDISHAQQIQPAFWRRRPMARRIQELFWKVWQRLL